MASSPTVEPVTGGTASTARAVPGPPRGRRRRGLAGVRDRIEWMRALESAPTEPAAVLRLVADVILLLKDLVVDPRVPPRAKLQAGFAVVYLVSPLDLVPDIVPVLGQLDDLGIAALAVRRLIGAAGYEVVYDLWRGSNEGLALVLSLAGVEQ